MKNKLTMYVLIGIVVALLGYIIYRSASRVEKDFTFPETVEVVDGTGIKNIDKYAAIISHNILELDTIHITIAKMPSHLKVQAGQTMSAWIQKDAFTPHKYFILWNTDITSNVHITLAHELYHLTQMERGDLEMFVGETYVIWKGDTIDFYEVPYDRRPHELEAHAFDGRIARDLNKILYE